jgi:hypothetical protein
MKRLIENEYLILENWKDVDIEDCDLGLKLWCNNLVGKGILRRHNKQYLLTKLGKKYIEIGRPKFTSEELEWHESVESL